MKDHTLSDNTILIIFLFVVAAKIFLYLFNAIEILDFIKFDNLLMKSFFISSKCYLGFLFNFVTPQRKSDLLDATCFHILCILHKHFPV